MATTFVPLERHGYFGDVPYIPPLEASMFFDDLRFCKTHRLPRDHMYSALPTTMGLKGTLTAAGHSDEARFFVAASAAAPLPTSSRLSLPLTPLTQRSAMCSFPHPRERQSSEGGSTSSQLQEGLLLGDRWVGAFTAAHRVPQYIEQSLAQLLPDGGAHVSMKFLYPQTPQDFGAILDDIIRSSACEGSASGHPSEQWIVLCNSDRLLASPHNAAVLGLFLWAFASLVHNHTDAFIQHDVRLVFHALGDEQGQLAVDVLLEHMDRTLRLPGRVLTSTISAAVPEEGLATPPLICWRPIHDEDEEESAAHSARTDIKGVVELVAKKVANLHRDICDNMLSGDISVDDAPIVLVWCGPGDGRHDTQATLSSLLKEELGGIYVPEPFRIVTTTADLRNIPVPFETSPVVVILHDPAELAQLVATAADKSMRLHSVAALGLDAGVLAPSTATNGIDIAAAAAHFCSFETLESDLLWVEQLLSVESKTETLEFFCPPQVFSCAAKRADVRTLAAWPQGYLTTSSEDVACVAAFLLWLTRRFNFHPTSETLEGADGASAPAKLSRRAARKAQIQAKHAVTSDKSAAVAGVSTVLKDAEVLMVVPRLLLIGHRDSAARRAVWDALEYLIVSQLCELTASSSPTDGDPQGGDDDDDAHEVSDAAHSLRRQVSSSLITMSLTPIGRLLSEDWKFQPQAGAQGSSVLSGPQSFHSLVVPKMILAACTMRLPLDTLVELLAGPQSTEGATISAKAIVEWCQSKGIRVPPSGNVLDISVDMLHSLKRVVVLWASVPHTQFAQAALNEPRGITMSRVEALLCAPHATRQSITPAPSRATSCRGWFPSSTVKGKQLADESSGDQENTHAAGQRSVQSLVAADSVPTYRFPPVYELCEILLDSDAISHGGGSSNNSGNFLCETPIELSELLVATKLLVSSMLMNNCILSQSEPVVHHSSVPQLRTNFLDVKLLQSTTWNSILSCMDVQQTLGGATASGLWVDGKFYDASVAPQTRLDELNHLAHHTPHVLEFCDRTALLLQSSKAARTEAEGDPNIFSGVVPGPKDKKVIDEFINTVARLGREKTEKSLKGKRGFAFLEEGDANFDYYLFHVSRV